MYTKIFIFGVFIFLPHRTIEGRNVGGDGVLSETNQTEIAPMDGSLTKIISNVDQSTGSSINFEQPTEYQYVENPDEDVSESIGQNSGRKIPIVRPALSRPTATHPSITPLKPPTRPPPTPPRQPPPTPPTRPPRRPPSIPPTRTTPTPSRRLSPVPPRGPIPTPPTRSTPPLPSKSSPSNDPPHSVTPKPNAPESTMHSVIPKSESTTHSQTLAPSSGSTTHSQYQTTPGHSTGIYTTTEHVTNKINGWLGVISNISNEISREISRWTTINTTPYYMNSTDAMEETTRAGSTDAAYALNVTESSAFDSTTVDDWTPISPDSTSVDDWTPLSPDVTEPNSAASRANVNETSISPDNTDSYSTDSTTGALGTTSELNANTITMATIV